MAKNKKSNQTGSETSTSFLRSLEDCQYITTVTNLAQIESQKIDKSKKKHTRKIGGKNNKTKFTVTKKIFWMIQSAY